MEQSRVRLSLRLRNQEDETCGGLLPASGTVTHFSDKATVKASLLTGEQDADSSANLLDSNV